jgi:peptidoglycan-associated lipoprotein
MFKKNTIPTVLSLLLAACAHRPAAVPNTEPSSPTPSSAPVTVPAPRAQEASCSTDSDCVSSHICIRGKCTEVTAGLAECGPVRLHFPFNSALLESPERTALERSARCLTANRSLHVTIAGHADDRGTSEYNLALGQERAAAVARYLASLGASQEQLRTVSYGEEKPLCTEADEGCRSQNRRATIPAPEQPKQ